VAPHVPIGALRAVQSLTVKAPAIELLAYSLAEAIVEPRACDILYNAHVSWAILIKATLLIRLIGVAIRRLIPAIVHCAAAVGNEAFKASLAFADVWPAKLLPFPIALAPIGRDAWRHAVVATLLLTFLELWALAQLLVDARRRTS